MSDNPTAITPNVYYNLGKKTYWYLFSKNSVTGFAFLLAALVLSVIRSNMARPELAETLRTASWISFAIAAASFLIAFISTRIIYKSTGFTVADNALILRRGVIKKEEYAIPYRQIQNIEIERTLGSQMLGISRLVILTAGEESELEKRDLPENILPAIDKDLAISLQSELLKSANIQKVIPA